MSDCCANNGEVAILISVVSVYCFKHLSLCFFVMYFWKDCMILTYYLGQVQVIFESRIPCLFSDNCRHYIKS